MPSLSTSRRPVLAALNANTPLGRSGAQSGLKSSETNSPTKPAAVADLLPQASLPEARMHRSNDEKAPVLGAKRKSDSEDVGAWGAKRLKESRGNEEDGAPHLPIQLPGSDVQEVSELLQTSAQGANLAHHDDPATAPTSPASSFTSEDNSALNDSQNTTITIPDENPLPPRPLPLTREQLRQKAGDIKLRLSLASYKVRTNQIDVPISRLEIRSSPALSRIPLLPRTTQSSQAQQTQQLPCPLTAPNIPNIGLQRSSAEKKRPEPCKIPFSPPAPSYPSAPGSSERLASPNKVANDATSEGS